MEPQPFGEIPSDEIVLVTKATTVVRSEQQARVFDPAGRKDDELRSYIDPSAVPSHPDDSLHAKPSDIGLHLGRTRFHQQTHVAGRRQNLPSILEVRSRVLEYGGF